MKISSQFNKKYHAVLGEICGVDKTIYVTVSGLEFKITLKSATVKGLKYLFKFIDEEYPKTKYGKIRKDLSKRNMNILTNKIGFPLSMTELDTVSMVNHLKAITAFAANNGFYVQDPEWEALYQLGDEQNG